MKRRTLLALCVAVLDMAQAPPPVMGDAHIQHVTYSADHVVTLQAAIGYALVVELAEDDRIETVVVGNAATWQVTANKQGDRLIIKPLGAAAPTDMVVATDARRYVFTLEPASGPDAAPFVVRFDYPQTVPAVMAAVTPVAHYRLHGDAALFPAAMTDDGHRTTVTWKADAPLPAIFALDDQGREAIVNGRMVEGDYVIEGVSKRYVFRRDKIKAVATRRLEPVSR